jgi:hypothetical protein
LFRSTIARSTRQRQPASDRLSSIPGRIVEAIEIDLPRPRWTYDARSRPDYLYIRQHLSNRLREMVVSDPESDFYVPSPPGGAG